MDYADGDYVLEINGTQVAVRIDRSGTNFVPLSDSETDTDANADADADADASSTSFDSDEIAGFDDDMNPDSSREIIEIEADAAHVSADAIMPQLPSSVVNRSDCASFCAAMFRSMRERAVATREREYAEVCVELNGSRRLQRLRLRLRLVEA